MKIKELRHSPYLGPFFVLSIVGLATPLNFAVQGSPPTTAPSVFDRQLAALATDARLEGEPSGPYDRQVEFLGQIRDTTAEWWFYAKVLNRIGAIGSTRSLPALEALLNRDEVWGHGGLGGDDFIIRLSGKASEAWFAIKWKGATEGQKIQTAFYGLQPDTPVKLDPQVSRDKVLSLGAPARAHFFELLRDRALDYGDTAWFVRGLSGASDVLANGVFAPTDAEIKAVLTTGGDWGKSVMIFYLSDQRDVRAIPALVRWFGTHQDEPDKLYRLTSCARKMVDAPAEQRTALIRALVAAGRQTQKRFRNKHYLMSRVDWYSVLYGVNEALSRLGDSPITIQYFREYLEFYKQLDGPAFKKAIGNPSFAAAALGTLRFGEEEATEALKRWKVPAE